MKYFLLSVFLLVGCSNTEYYRITCNEYSGTYVTEKMLLEHLDKNGFKCKNNKASITKVKNKKWKEKLNKVFK